MAHRSQIIVIISVDIIQLEYGLKLDMLGVDILNVIIQRGIQIRLTNHGLVPLLFVIIGHLVIIMDSRHIK